ncbi:activating signal cointegrator 1 complex subunit 2 isoform X2 [Manihot esculenta]|nr:activating signal cointegrator 1 complex subunit 2 isoform X2 [Manihot esculenta]
MSQRYSHNNNNKSQQESSSTHARNFPKNNKKFIPRNQNPNPTLSNSLRQSLSKQSDSAAAASTASSGAASSSRVRMGDNKAWVSSRTAAGPQDVGNFINYLPQDEAVAAGLGAEEGGLDPVESQRVVDLLNSELSRLLKLSPREFWREDLPTGIQVLGLLILLVQESMQDKKLLDLPKLLDICAIYGHENEELTQLLVANALQAQTGIHDNLTAAMSQFLEIVNTMFQRCISSLEALFSSASHEDRGSSSLHYDFLEVMDFINDAVVSMDAFINAYKPAAAFFSCPVETSYGIEELLVMLARLHDTLLPSLQRGFRIMLTGGDEESISNISVSLKMLSMRIFKLGWKLLDICYLSNEVFTDCLPLPAITKIFPAKVEDPVIRADILIQTFREISGVLLYTQDNQHRNTFLQNLDKNYHLMSKLQSLQDAGWIFIDDEQLQYLSGIMMCSLKGTVKEQPVMPIPVSNNKVEMDEDAAIKESKISQIKDLFPDYGKGFLAACLEVYNQDPEEVIQRILEGTLHEDLKCLDTSLQIMPTAKSALTKDKGKGKLVESTPFPSTTPTHSTNTGVAGERQFDSPSVSSSSTVGRFVRKSHDVQEHYTLNTRDDKDAARTMALISQYEYEDEYDDSFDDLGLSVADSGLEENEIFRSEVGSSLGKPSGTESVGSVQTASSTKWGSRKKPQYFVKDGKNYSYKVAGSVAVANSDEASLVNQAQGDLIYGLGRGGNLPIGAVKKLMEYQEQEQQRESDEPETEGRGNTRNPRGRGRRGGGGRPRESHEEQDNQSDGSEMQGRGNAGNPRGRGRRGRGNNNYRKDRAMHKHFSGLSGF